MVDLSAIPATQRHEQARQAAVVEAERPFNLATGAPLRATLLRLSADQHVLVLTMHHIVTDGWSVAILLDELTVLYTAFLPGHPSPLSSLPLRSIDFAVWEQASVNGDTLADQLDYWRKQLADSPTVLELPADHPHPSQRSWRRPLSFTLPPELARELRSFTRAHGGTLFMTLLAGFQTLLARYCGTEDVAVGAPVAGRTRAELEGLIGFFVNTLVLRTDCSGDPSFREFFGRVRETALAAYAHQDVPFERLVQALRPERHSSRSPLFQVMFSVEREAEGGLALPGLTCERFPLPLRAAKLTSA